MICDNVGLSQQLSEVYAMPSIVPGQKIQVYKNLTTGNWSVRTKTAKGWRLNGHYEELTVANATPRTSKCGATRIRSTKSREVVAWIDCEFVSFETTGSKIEVHYNPYRQFDFHYTDGSSFTGCKVAHFPPKSNYFTEVK